MKTVTKFGIFAVCIVWACMALLHAQAPPSKSQPDNDCTQWIESCLTDFESIKAGMTRGEVERKFSKDGGLQTVSPVRFTHPTCGLFKIDVEFEYKQDAADQGRAIVGESDGVTKVSRPYIERPFMD